MWRNTHPLLIFYVSLLVLSFAPFSHVYFNNILHICTRTFREEFSAKIPRSFVNALCSQLNSTSSILIVNLILNMWLYHRRCIDVFFLISSAISGLFFLMIRSKTSCIKGATSYNKSSSGLIPTSK